MCNTPPQEPPSIPVKTEGAISLPDIVQLIKDGKHWIFWATTVCALLGASYAFLAPAKYQASLSFEMASVDGNVMEDPYVLVEKLELPLYYSLETHKTCAVENRTPSPGQYLADHIRPAVKKSALVVTIEYRAESANLAKVCLESVFSDIRKHQEILLKPILAVRNSQLQALQKELEDAEKLLKLLPAQKNLNLDFNDPKFPASALLLTTSIAKQDQIKDLRARINEIQASLLAPKTHDVTLATPIYAPDIKVEPKTGLLILFSAISGIFIGIFILFCRRFLGHQEKM